MRKIIITFIATIILVTPFEKAQGQSLESQIIANSPTVNILTGVNAKISFGLWRLEPFVQIGRHLQMFEERMYVEGWGFISESYSPRFASGTIANTGMRFRITDNDRIKIGYLGVLSNSLRSRFGDQVWEQFYLGYIRRVNLSQRMSLDLSVSHTSDWFHLLLDLPHHATFFQPAGVSHFRFSDFTSRSFSYHSASIGAKLNFEVIRNLRLYGQLNYTRRYSVESLGVPASDGVLTRNLLEFTIGIHYHLARGRAETAIRQRQPRQRVAPSTFNHPTLPPRTR